MPTQIMSCDHKPSPNPRVDSCVICGRPMPQPRPRNLPLEKHLTELASNGNSIAANHLSSFADRRAWAGGVWPKDLEQEAKEELADARSYLCWAIEPIWHLYLEGDAEAGKTVARCLTALSAVVSAWVALNT